MNGIFENRVDAGRRLAEKLRDFVDQPDVLVLGLARGGVPVAYEISNALRAPLDVVVVRKIGAPERAELAIGAVAPSGVHVNNRELVEALDISDDELEMIIERARRDLDRRELAYRGERLRSRSEGKDVLLVDDGLATGATMQAAITFVKNQNPASVTIAAPVGASSTCNNLREKVDRVVTLTEPDIFYGISQFYQDFEQVSDQEVRELLQRSRSAGPTPPSASM